MSNQCNHSVTKPGVTPTKPSPALPVRIGAAALAVLTCVLAVIAVGALAPDVPVLGAAGTVLAVVSPWTALLGGALAFLALALRRRRRTRTRLVALVAALVVVLTSGSVTGAQVAAAHRHEVSVAPVDLLTPFSVADPDETLAYPLPDGTTRRIHVWRPSGAHAGARTAPVLLDVHGGGWISGAADENPHARWFTDHGWLVVSPQYDLSDENTHLWNEVPTQIGCAMAWTGRHAAELGGDIDRFVVSGGSAGGNIAINATYRAATGSLPMPCGDVPRVAAVSTIVPPVDSEFAHTNAEPFFGAGGRAMIEQYIGGTPAEFPERYAAASGATHASPQAPPTLVVSGAADHLVPREGAAAFAQKARAAGADVGHIEVPYAGHAFDLGPGAGAQIYRQATARWFAQHGVSPTAPTTDPRSTS